MARRPSKTLFSFGEEDATAEAVERADNVTYLPSHEAEAVAQPDTIDCGWHELEYDELAAEQPPRHTARGEAAARPYTVVAESWKERRTAAQDAIETQKDVVQNEKARLELTEQALHGFTRRAPHDKAFYLLRWCLLLLGDIAGIAGAAVLLGEIPSLAVLQAVASAIAAVTAGLVGNDIRDARLARRRARDTSQILAEHQPFAWVFSGSDVGEKIVHAMVWVALLTTVLIGAGIFTLRTGVEGGLGGMVFGCLAVAICLASAINSYNYADEVADLLDQAHDRYVRALRRYHKLANSPAVSQFDGASAEAASIKAEFEQLGIAAEHRVRALSHGISRNNPAVMGHGPAPQRPADPSLFSEIDRFEIDRPYMNGARR